MLGGAIIPGLAFTLSLALIVVDLLAVIVVIRDQFWSARSDEEVQRIKLHILSHVALVRGLQVVLHLVGSRELLSAHRAGEDLTLSALVVQEGVSLEAVLILERLLDILFSTLRTLIDALADHRVPKEIKSPHTHLGQLLGRIIGRTASLPADPSSNLLSRRMCRSTWHTSATLGVLHARTGERRIEQAAATAGVQQRCLSRRRWGREFIIQRWTLDSTRHV